MTKLDWQVYALECSDGSIYIGIAKDPAKRFDVHRSGKGSKYVRSRLPIKLVWVSIQYTHSDALKSEARLKKFSHEGKKAFIERSLSFRGQNSPFTEKLQPVANDNIPKHPGE